MTAWAHDERTGLKLKPIFSSDVGHFDVINMSGVLEEAHELLEHGQLDEGGFREFTFSNALGLYTRMNPTFFDGTVIEAAANEERSRGR